MPFYADLHIHSKYSRATSKHCDLEHLALWARKKGITVVATGDFTHPAWLAELKDKLMPAEPGLFRLRTELEQAMENRLPGACYGTTRFILSVEISTIYKKGERTRKVHHLIYVPDFASADKVVDSLSRIGNLRSDGRPILGLDSRHLLEIVLQSGAGSYLVPAHIWTPWFAALGSKSGFDAIDACYADLAPHIFAVETGLSSDPAMNWRVSSLDRFRLVSNSDAHSPEKLGREACVFDTDLNYFAMRQALETGQGYVGTVEFFPEEGKYHLDGHRACNVRFSPSETREAGGRCPVCGKPVTVGVMHRVEELADRSHAEPPATAGTVQSLVPLPEMLAEICQVGAKSKRVSQHYESLLGQLGPELALLNEVPLEDIRNTTSSLLAEAIARLRRHEVICEAGFDGEYGTIRLFQAEELRQRTLGASLFAIPTSPPQSAAQSRSSAHPTAQARETSGGKTAVLPVATAPAQRPLTGHESSAKAFDLLSELDTEQRLAATAGPGPLLIVAGPGSGKTRTLMYRLAHLVCHHGVPATQCLAITFTHRAAEEMRQRLHRLLPEVWTQIPVLTFHALGLGILREHWNAAGLQRGFRIVAEAERLRLLGAALGSSASQARRLLAAISHHKRTAIAPAEAKLAHAYQIYQQELEIRNLVDYDDLIGRAGAVLASDPGLQALYQARYPWVFIDEYQDVDEQQVRLLKLLVPPHGNVCAIGDPDQAIYGFRGADVRFFQRFPEDFPTAQVVRLTRNYRSDRHIVTLSSQVLGRAGGEPRSVAVRASEPSLITLHEAPSEKAEAEFVVQAIEQMLGGHSFFSIDSGRTENGTGDAVSFADVAILYRTEAQTPALVEALQRSGMPFQKRSHALLTEHPGVAILLDTLRQGQRQGSLYEQLQAAVAHATSQVETPLAAAEITSLHEALDLVKPLAEACGEDVERFLTDLALEVQVDTRDARADRISLLTLHASKGLEFPVVFLVGCEETLLPLTWGSAADTDLEEERRLFYVGVTRAQNRLFLCRARQRLWRGRVQAMAPSPYLADIEEGLLERRHTRLQGGHRMPERQLNLF